jgi:DNA topoisomerase-1
VRDGRIQFDFLAKGGKRRVEEVRDPELLPAISTLKRRRSGGVELLAYREHGRWRDVRSSDVNDYVRETAGGDYTAKDFRTWHATVLAAASLAAKDGEARPNTSRARLASSAVKEVAELLGNTPAVARASYVDPRVIDLFEQGITIAGALDGTPFDGSEGVAEREAIEAAVLDLLDERSSAGDRAA